MNSLWLWFKNLRLSLKLIIMFLIVGLVPLGTALYFANQQTSESLRNTIFDELQGIRTIKKNQVATYFNERQADTENLVNMITTIRNTGYTQLTSVTGLKADHIEGYFKRLWNLTETAKVDPRFTNGIQTFSKAFAAGVNSAEYRNLLQTSDPVFARYVTNAELLDVLFIDANGTVIYSTTKGSELGNNVGAGALRDSGLARVFAKSRQQSAIEDFSFYEPIGKTVLLTAAPLVVDNRYLGSLVFVVDKTAINQIAHDQAGLYDTFESYLVGVTDGKTSLRSDRIVKEGKIGDAKTGPDVDAALSRNSGRGATDRGATAAGRATGQMIKEGSTNELEVSTYQPLNIPGLQWVLLTTGSLEALLTAARDKQTDDFIKKFAETYGYYDLFLIGPNGHVFYTVKRESDYQTNR